MKLYDGSIKGRYKVKNIDLDLKIVRRLEALGMTDGTSLNILNKKRDGALIINVRGTRLAIGKDISKGIEVEQSRRDIK